MLDDSCKQHSHYLPRQVFRWNRALTPAPLHARAKDGPTHDRRHGLEWHVGPMVMLKPVEDVRVKFVLHLDLDGWSEATGGLRAMAMKSADKLADCQDE